MKVQKCWLILYIIFGGQQNLENHQACGQWLFRKCVSFWIGLLSHRKIVLCIASLQPLPNGNIAGIMLAVQHTHCEQKTLCSGYQRLPTIQMTDFYHSASAWEIMMGPYSLTVAVSTLAVLGLYLTMQVLSVYSRWQTVC